MVLRRLLAPVVLVALGVALSVASTSAAPATPLAGITVNIDPGHNPGNARHTAQIDRIVHRGPIRKACDTTGTATNDGYAEARFTLQLARRLQTRLQAQGATVTLTHTETTPAWGPCITQRADIGNRADVSISLHADGNTARTARGFHVIRPGFVRGYTGDILRPSSALAVQVRDELVASTDLVTSTYVGRRGIDVRTDLGGLTLSDVPKVMLETGNMRNAGDARLLRSAAEQDRIARALTVALVRWQAAGRR